MRSSQTDSQRWIICPKTSVCFHERMPYTSGRAMSGLEFNWTSLGRNICSVYNKSMWFTLIEKLMMNWWFRYDKLWAFFHIIIRLISRITPNISLQNINKTLQNLNWCWATLNSTFQNFFIQYALHTWHYIFFIIRNFYLFLKGGLMLFHALWLVYTFGFSC